MDKIYNVISYSLYNKPYLSIYHNSTNKGYNINTYNDILFYLPTDSDFTLLEKLINDFCEYDINDDGEFLPNGIGLRKKRSDSYEDEGIADEDLYFEEDYEEIARREA